MKLIGNFKDSQNIKIEDGIPKYRYDGPSFRDKLKNGLPLHDVFKLENYCSAFQVIFSVTKRVSFAECLTTIIVLDSSEFELDEPDIVFPKLRKGKWNSFKKPSCSNFKKDRRKQLGHSDKQFNQIQNTNFEFDEEEIDDDFYDDDTSYQGNSHIVRAVKNVRLL